MEHLLAEIPDVITTSGAENENGKRQRDETRRAEYLVGITVVPKNIMDGAGSFSAVDALDCGTSK